MRIAMIGTGYVGLVSGACFSEFGITVTCVDKDVSKIERLKRGIMPIYEPGLDQLVEANVKAGRLEFTTDLKWAVGHGTLQFIGVGKDKLIAEARVLKPGRNTVFTEGEVRNAADGSLVAKAIGTVRVRVADKEQ